jgi:hypothetical protein
MAYGSAGLAGAALHMEGAFRKKTSYEGFDFCPMDIEGTFVHVLLPSCSICLEDFRTRADNRRDSASEVIPGYGED